MAENLTEALKLFESANGAGDNQESGTVRLVRVRLGLPAKRSKGEHVKNQAVHYNLRHTQSN
jgi:hypothetical protein